MKTCPRGHTRPANLTRCPTCRRAARLRHAQASPEANRARVLQWQKAHPHRARAKVRRHRGAVRRAGPYHLEAMRRFRADPSVAFQAHIARVAAERDPRPKMPSLDGCRVEAVTRAEAEPLIRTYEWLGTLGPGKIFYGLRAPAPNNELLGVVAFGRGAGTFADGGSVLLERGTCVHWAPRNAASYLISRACRLATIDHGWRTFYAYADPAAGERGTIYKACNWTQEPPSRRGRPRDVWIDPSGHIHDERALRHRGWKIADAEAAGWVRERRPAKSRFSFAA